MWNGDPSRKETGPDIPGLKKQSRLPPSPPLPCPCLPPSPPLPCPHVLFLYFSNHLPITLTHKCQPPGCSHLSAFGDRSGGLFFSSPSAGLGRGPDKSTFPKAPTDGKLPGRHLLQAKNVLLPRMVRQLDKLRLMVFHQGVSQSLANSLPVPPFAIGQFPF